MSPRSGAYRVRDTVGCIFDTVPSAGHIANTALRRKSVCPVGSWNSIMEGRRIFKYDRSIHSFHIATVVTPCWGYAVKPWNVLSPVSIQTQSLALRTLRALRKRKPQETQALALASSQSWLPLLRPSIPIGWRLRLLRENLRFLRFSFTQRTLRKRLRLNGNRA